jgi:hypothetical protein
MSRAKTSVLTARVTPKLRAQFVGKAQAVDLLPSEVLREMVEAFVDGRLVIHPPVTPKESLYVPRTED